MEHPLPVNYHDNVIKNNYIFYEGPSDEVAIYCKGDNCIITGNMIDCADSYGYSALGTGIYIKTNGNNTVSNNVIQRVRYGIQLHNSDGNIITNNVFKEYNQLVIKGEGQEVKNNIIMGNDLRDFSNADLFFLTGPVSLDSQIIKDNIGYDYSSYQYIPAGTSNPFSNPNAGAMWLNTTTNELGIYNGASWIWK